MPVDATELYLKLNMNLDKFCLQPHCLKIVDYPSAYLRQKKKPLSYKLTDLIDVVCESFQNLEGFGFCKQFHWKLAQKHLN